MNDDRLSRPAPGARTRRSAVLLGVVVLSLVGCSAEGRSGTESLVAVEQAQAEAAAELAEAQDAIDRQVEAADALKAEARAAADAAAQQAAAAEAAKSAAAAEKAAADRVAAEKAAAGKAAAAPAAPKRAAAGGAAMTTVRPPQRTPVSGTKATPGGAGAEKALPSAVQGPPPVVTRPARAAAVPDPVVAGSRPAVTKPAAQPEGAVSTDDLHVVVAPGGTVSVPGHESVAAGCEPQDFHAGDRVRLATEAGATVRETVLPACQRAVVSAPGTGVAITSPRFSVTLPGIAWRHGDAWVLQIGAHQWPVTASTLSEHGWSIAVTAEAGVTAGPTAEVTGDRELLWDAQVVSPGPAAPH